MREQEIERKQQELNRKRQAVEAQIVALRSALEAEEEELLQDCTQATEREERRTRDRAELASKRKADADGKDQ